MAECLARVFYFDASEPRFLAWNGVNLVSAEGGTVKYLPNRELREAAVYGSRVEYDIRRRSNDMGYLDARDYGKDSVSGGRRIAFAGDSFTAGAGNGPWVPVLRDKIRRHRPDVEIYALGVDGAGFDNFRGVLLDLSRRVALTDIVILAISDDFERPAFRPLFSGPRVWFCREGESDRECMKKPVMAFVVPDKTSKSDIIRCAKEESAKIRRVEGFPKNLKLIKLVQSMMKKEKPLSDAARKMQDGFANLKRGKSFLVLKKIRQDFPGARVHFIHLPQKEEVSLGRHKFDPREAVESLGITYHSILDSSWKRSHFHRLDSHPKPSGYKKISESVEKILKETVLK